MGSYFNIIIQINNFYAITKYTFKITIYVAINKHHFSSKNWFLREIHNNYDYA